MSGRDDDESRPYQSLHPFATGAAAEEGATASPSVSGRNVEDRPPSLFSQISMRHFGLFHGDNGNDPDAELVEPRRPPPFVRAVSQMRERLGEALEGLGNTVENVVDVALHDPRRFSTYFSISTRIDGEGSNRNATVASNAEGDGDETEIEDVVADRNFTPLSGIFRSLRASPPVRWVRDTPVGKWFVRNIIGATEDEHHVHYHRLIDRSGKFFQSLGRMAIKKRIRSEDWHALYAGDLFHSLVDAPTARTLLVLLSAYFFLVVAFSIPYFLISKIYGCDMGIDTYQEAFAFSLETMATIGYGTQDIFFNNCWSPVITLGTQISCKLIAEAVIIGVIYCRFGRPSKRASTIIFTDKAIIRRIGGKLYFMFQLVELRKHQLVEAQVRLYAIRRDVALPGETETEADGGGDGSNGGDGSTARRDTRVFTLPGSNGFPPGAVTHFQTCKMRLSFPNDELGGLLIMCLPQVIVHEIDAWSPLMPPPEWRAYTDGQVHRWAPPVFDNACRPSAAACSPRRPAFDPNNSSQFSEKSSVADRSGEDFHRRAMRAVSFPNVVHRSESVADVVGDMDGEGEDDEDDDDDDEDEDVSHGGDIFQSGLASPHLAQKSPTAKDGQSHHVAFGRGGRSASKFSATTSQVDEELLADRYHEEKEMIQRFMADRKMEIFAIVEGIDATTGGPCQARHSYVTSEVEWDKSFAQCVFEDDKDGSAVIDFSCFHGLVDVHSNAAHCGSVPSHT